MNPPSARLGGDPGRLELELEFEFELEFELEFIPRDFPIFNKALEGYEPVAS